MKSVNEKSVKGQLAQIPMEAWECLGEMPLEGLTRFFNKLLESEMMPNNWR